MSELDNYALVSCVCRVMTTCETSSVDGDQSVTQLLQDITGRLAGQQLTVQPDDQQTTAMLPVHVISYTRPVRMRRHPLNMAAVAST